MALTDLVRPDNVEEVCNPYNSELSTGLPGVMVSGDWDEAVDQYVRAADIKAVYLNSAKGWKGTDFSFLDRLYRVEELNIIASKGEHLEAVEGMVQLRSLSLTCDTRSTIDFSLLGQLTDCYLLWWKGANSIFDASKLERLYLDGARLEDFAPLGNLSDLRYLTVANSNIADLEPLQTLHRLECLELINCRQLKQFETLGNLPGLDRLTIRGCKSLHDLGFLRSLRNLEVLILSDNDKIASLSPVSGLKKLKALAFAGNTNIEDGDLTVLTRLPQLAMLMFASRRHYSHKLVKTWNWKNFEQPDTLLEAKRG